MHRERVGIVNQNERTALRRAGAEEQVGAGLVRARACGGVWEGSTEQSGTAAAIFPDLPRFLALGGLGGSGSVL